MTSWQLLRTRTLTVQVFALAALTAGCRELTELTPLDGTTAAARGGGGGVTVTSVVPDNSALDVTLDITVNGSGFDQGSVARLERQGQPSPKITTNATTFVTPKKLIANITIAADADTGKYDVAVIALDGRKGVGIEQFTVTYVVDELGIIGGTWSRAHAINERGEVVGASCTQDCLSTAFYWSEADGQVDLGGMPGYSRSAAYTITSRGEVFGEVFCYLDDTQCSVPGGRQNVRWDRVGSTWTVSPVEGCSIGESGVSATRFLINNNNQCVKRTFGQPLLLQTISGGSVVSEEPLPHLIPGGFDHAAAISDAVMIAGFAGKNGLPTLTPVIWYRNGSGAWVVLQLTVPGADYHGWANDVSEPDASGQVWVSGYTEKIIAGRYNANRYKGTNRAVRWKLAPDGQGTLQEASFEVLPAASSTGTVTDSWALGINSAGDAVGMSGSFTETAAPVLWSAGSGAVSLPTATQAASGLGRAVDINNSGWIVGAVFDNGSGCDRAAIWRQR